MDWADAAPVPTTFVAVTVNLYGIPVVSPGTVIGLAVLVATIPPGTEVTVYKVIALPPLEAGAVKGTLTEVALSLTAVPIVGAPGTVAGVTAAEAVDAGPIPTPFVAVTLKV